MLDSIEISKHFQSALLFNVPPSLKRLSFGIEGNNIVVEAVFDKDPEEYEKDCIWSTVGEVKGNFSYEPKVSTTLVVESSSSKVENLEHLVFARYEAERY